MYCTVNKHTKTQIGLLISRFLFPHFMSRDITIFKHVIMHGIFMHQSYQIQKGYMFYGFARVWVDKSNTKLTRILIQISSFFILIKYVCTAKTFLTAVCTYIISLNISLCMAYLCTGPTRSRRVTCFRVFLESELIEITPIWAHQIVSPIFKLGNYEFFHEADFVYLFLCTVIVNNNN